MRIPGPVAIVALSLCGSVGCADGGGSSGVGTAATIGPGGDSSTTGETPDDDSDDDPSSTLPTSAGSGSTTGSAGTEESTGGSSSTGPIEPPDLADGVWVFENVSDTPAMSLHAQRTRLDDGTEVVAWSETSPNDIGVLNIRGANQAGVLWPTAEITAYSASQNTYPELAPGGAVALLAWSGTLGSNDDRDIYLAASDGTAWTSARSLTNGFDSPVSLSESHPVVMRRPGAEAIVAYTSEDPLLAKGGLPPITVYVTEFGVDSTPNVEIPLVLPVHGRCSDLVGVMSTDGVGHILLQCSGGDSGLMHGTDRSGEWDANGLSGVGTGVLSPSIAAGPDGEVYAVWIQKDACGADLCDDVFFVGTTDDVFGTPVNVTKTANLDERMPAVGVDAWGRVFVFSQARVDGATDIYLSVSEDGQTFGPSERITPNDNDDQFQSPGDVLFGMNGAPSFVFEYVFSGSTPLNIDIEVARFIPN